MKEKDKNKSGRSEFLRYISGEMADGEKNAFERNLQKDGFAEEASEGLTGLSDDQLKTDMSRLDKSLRSRVSRNKTVVFYRIAASVAVLMVLSSVFIILNRESPAEKSAEISIQPATIDISESKAIKEPEVAHERTDNLRIAEDISAGKAETHPPEKVAEGILQYNEAEAARSEKVDGHEKVIMARTEERPTEILADRQKTAIPAAATGQVAGVTLKKTSDAMELDAKKNITDSMISALDEVVVVGYGADQKAENEFTGYSPPVPSIGKAGFENYIIENIRKPSALAGGERAVVVISILVRSSGVIDSMRVIRSPGKVFSDEAMRLIREGPAWTPANNNGVKIDDETRIRIIFK